MLYKNFMCSGVSKSTYNGDRGRNRTYIATLEVCSTYLLHTVIGCNGRISYLHTWESTTPCSTNIKLRYWLSHVGIEPTSYIPDSPESPNATYRFQKKPVTWAKRIVSYCSTP